LDTLSQTALAAKVPVDVVSVGAQPISD
jgi:hypothetical protein